jgi:hypothetical protein
MSAPSASAAGAAAPADEGGCSEYYSDSEGSYYSYTESDDELDWDPDRERLIRFVRKEATRQRELAARGGSANETPEPPRLSIAERRSAWRAARGLAREKTVAEIVAERRANNALRRAAQEEARHAPTPPRSAPPPPPPPPRPPRPDDDPDKSRPERIRRRPSEEEPLSMDRGLLSLSSAMLSSATIEGGSDADAGDVLHTKLLRVHAAPYTTGSRWTATHKLRSIRCDHFILSAASVGVSRLSCSLELDSDALPVQPAQARRQVWAPARGTQCASYVRARKIVGYVSAAFTADNL